LTKKRLSINIVGKVPPPIGGVTIHTLRLYEWLQKNDEIDVKLTALNQHKIDDENIKYVGNYPLWIIKKIFFGFKENIVHYQGANYFGLIILYIINIIHPSFKLILSIHGEGYMKRLLNKNILRKVIFNILNKLDGIICDEKHLKEQLKENGIKNNNMYIVDPFLMPNADKKKEYPQYVKDIFNTKDFLISANAFNVDKLNEDSDLYGLNILSALANKLNENNIKFKMIILIACINDKEYINKLFKNNNNIYIVSDNDINGWQIISDSNLMIRSTSTDGNALSIYEALSFNVPVIASDVVPRDKNVILFEYPNIDNLYEKVINIVSRKVQLNIKLDNNIKLFQEVYRKII
jgi:glycosyltransferase involved in cell wall biosynthesis